MTRVERRLVELGLELAEPAAPVGSYSPAVLSGRYVFVSGQLPLTGGALLYEGKVGGSVTLEEGMQAARLCALNSISALRAVIQDLDRVRRVVKVTGFVASAQGFTRQAQVVNGASDLYVELFGSAGRHARAAVGVYELPLGSPVEIDLVAEVAP